MRASLFVVVLATVLSSAACSLPGAAPARPPEPLPTSVALLPTERSTTPADTALTTLSPPSGAADLRGVITIDGSSTVFPITEAAALAFRTYAPQVEIRLGVSGTGGGFAKFCAGETVISDASRPITAAEAAQCAAAGVSFIELPVAYDGISLVIHPTNTWAECISLAELQQIWAAAAGDGIATWSQVRPDWPNAPLDLYGAGSDSGTYDYFVEAVLGAAVPMRSDYVASEDDYLIAQDVAENPNGMGFFGYSYYVEHEGRLRAVAIDGGAGCTMPTATTIADGSYQPLARPIFIYVRAEALAEPALRAFVDFYLANAPILVARARYIPLPERAYALAADRVAAGRTGSAFSDGVKIGASIDDLFSLEERP